MFLGEYRHSLDAKGRVILPARFRAYLGEGCVLTKGQDHCLYGYPKDEWQRVADRLREAPVTDQRVRDFLRVFFSGSHEDQPDSQGRVSIPEHLRRYAGLSVDGELVVAGLGSRFEVWDRARWDERLPEMERGFSEVRERHPELQL